MSEELVSIIVPIYNAEYYLEKCIESVLALKNDCWQLILVNDGSKDSSADICKKYCKHDSRILYLEQENAGVSVARNNGIRNADGEWITFLDADDMLLPDALDLIRLTNSGDHMILARYTSDERVHVYLEKCQRISGADLQKSILNLRQFKVEHPDIFTINDFNRWSCWGRFFRKDIIQKFGIEFPSGIKLSEDLLFCLRFACESGNIVLNDSIIYYYRENQKSVTHQFHLDRVNNTVQVLQGVSECLLQEVQMNYLDVFVIDQITTCCVSYYTDSRSGLNNKMAEAELKTLCEKTVVEKAILNCGYCHLASGKKNRFFNGYTLWFLKHKMYRFLVASLRILRKYR